MKNLTLVLLMAVYTIPAFSQNGEWWKVEDYGLNYELPGHWASDPFSSSSVCDCPGTINDNGEWLGEDYVGMVVYPVSDDEMESDNRQQVWGYGFVPGEAVEHVEYAGIPYTAVYGSFLDMKGWPKVLQLTSEDKVGSKYKNLIIYLWAAEKTYDAEFKTMEAILNTIERKKVK